VRTRTTRPSDQFRNGPVYLRHDDYPMVAVIYKRRVHCPYKGCFKSYRMGRKNKNGFRRLRWHYIKKHG